MEEKKANLKRILQDAELFIKTAEKAEEDAEKHITSFSGGVENYHKAVYFGIKALYEQNRALIELLKEYKKTE